MKPLNADQINQLFKGIRRAPGRDARYAPHKPLMLLMALARIQQGQHGHFAFTEVEPELKKLLTEFGPSNAPNTRHLPFWHLHSDEQGKLWDLQLPTDLQNHPRGKAPSLSSLRREGVSGGFTAPVEQALRSHPNLIPKLARELLHSTFPETLHEDIANALGLDLTDTEPSVQDAESIYQRGQRRQRNRAFRERVLRVYEYRCCVCGFDLRLGHLPAGLEAAHIQWHTVGGPDIEQNGLSLCALHHKLFDLGAFTLEPSSLKIVFSEHAMSGSRGLTGELRHHGQDFIRPISMEATPGPAFLKWNWSFVFKKKARLLQP
ncbi:phosphorothioated DNA-binding restriction endonuclease [Hydrogenophaga sp.]|uniref:phosphorothioated DNA-binding restriction endonuclease n=1 Tax=Hydrogenophaga sp. TaxID=1904254 RepID=UPI0035AFBFEF